MELKIEELAEEYKKNRDDYMRVRAKTKKKVRVFESFIKSNHLKKDDIIENERKFFEFCDFCKEAFYFECREFSLSWRFYIECKCDRAKNKLEKEMRERIKKNKKECKYEVQRLF